MNDLSRRDIMTAGAAAAALTMIPTRAQARVESKQDMLRLGCCYYPEHWDPAQWPKDAADMVARGITRVRIAEFAWTRMEPEPGVYDWAWLDAAIAALAKAGLGIVLGTPTASPPAWLVEKYPEILPVGADGRTKGFGSRRYYSFASLRYRDECQRIVAQMADRYGRHPSVVGWQIDNEYGCHDTSLSYSAVDLEAFRLWLKQRYGTVAKLNAAWGAVVWSQEVSSFEEVDLPISTPTDPSPMKLLDYRLFTSEQVRAFQQVQIDVLRPRSPDRFITTNFMGNFTEFDHYSVGDPLDFASWDSYPLGVAASLEDTRWSRTGNPDITAWNHSVMRAINPAPFWIMEQQPGPVNWAKSNPVPLPGMVRLWTWEAFAHGASTVSYFRWRQVPFGPEQMHSGLNRPDGSISVGGIEAERVGKEIGKVGTIPPMTKAKVALLFDYRTVWTTAIQPNAVGQNHLANAQAWFSALRQLGLDVDIVRPGADLKGYALVVAPCLSYVEEAARRALAAADGLVVAGPRTGSKSEHFEVATGLPPGSLRPLLNLKVTQVGAVRLGTGASINGEGIVGRVADWRETLETDLPVLARYEDDQAAAVVGGKRAWYVGCQGDAAFLSSLMQTAARHAGIETKILPDSVRLRRRGKFTFAFNYGPGGWNAPVPDGSTFLLGGPMLGPADLAIWKQA